MQTNAALKKIDLGELELVRTSQVDTAMDASVSFPFSRTFPATTGLELEGGHNVVYFELAPGAELGTHTDSPEELVVCLDGDDIEAWVGDERARIETNDLVVVPPMAPHGFRNAGTETARFLGCFSDATVVSEFEAPVEPLGETVLRT
ncbi:cupin domain-containing protein [Halorubellus salinus]|uniref:cupin domain-containing protein n=1 Tax=Halorubellus salinus TaxID=755309 RepID=UPI001D096CA4|nr:cupin domain-containing protein [Halorubellus salinus]